MQGKTLVAALAATLGLAAAAGEITDRFVYTNCDLCNPKRMAGLCDLARKAAASGYTGLVVQGDIQYAFHFGEAQRRELRKFKQVCDEVGIEIVPAVWSIGYGAMLYADPNVAEGIPCRDIPYVASADGAKAVYAAEPANVNDFDGGFERAKDLGGGKFTLPGFDFTEKPGTITFIDRDVKHSGKASLRFECAPTDPKDPQARARVELKVKPYSRYLIGMWWKTEDLDPSWGLQATYYTVPKPGEVDGMTQHLSFTNPRIGATGDWTYMPSELSTLGHDRIQLWFGSWKSRQGRVWVDDITVRLAGLEDVIRREGCPFEVKGAANGVVYEEGRDYAAVPPMGKAQQAMPRENGSIVLTLPKGSRIRPGERLLVSGCRKHVMKGNSQVNSCMSSPRLYELVDESAKCLAEIVRPKKWFLPQDEIRAGGSCTLCADPKHSMADLFVNCVNRMHATIRKYTPEAKIYMWGDQLDPNMNGKVVPMMCKGSFAGSIDRIPKDIVIMHWGGKVPETLKYFREHGFATARSIAAFDGAWTDKKTEVARKTVADVKADPGCQAVMFTTWSGDYGNLARFAEFCK